MPTASRRKSAEADGRPGAASSGGGPRSTRLLGHALPRIGPPLPDLRDSQLQPYLDAADELGIRLMPWQVIAARYLTCRAADDYWAWLYVCIVAARQNGKTTLLLPHIWSRLKMGRRILHTAQNRILPKETFDALDDLVGGNALVKTVRRANGQEFLQLHNGGRYKIVAPNRGTRGLSADDVIIDEVREQRDMLLEGRIGPTITAAEDPQVVYLSNAGSDDSVVLNDLRKRRLGGPSEDPALCYLEWSAEPGRSLDDQEGWAESNPGLGYTINLRTLATFRRSESEATWETERLCRWVRSMAPGLVPDGAWDAARADEPLGDMLRPAAAISMAPDARRAAAVLSWQLSDGRIAVQVLADVTGDPIDTEVLGRDLQQRFLRLGVSGVAYDDATDRDLARYVERKSRGPGGTLRQLARPLTGKEWRNACEFFPRALTTGRVAWHDDATGAVAQDLAWSVRDVKDDVGVFEVGRANDERSIPLTLATVRAVWVAAGPRPRAPRVQ